MHDQAFYTDTAAAAVRAYREAVRLDYLDAAIKLNLYDHFPRLAAAHAVWQTHLVRDEEQHEAAQPSRDADGYVDLLDTDRVEFGPEQWSEWTRSARRSYEGHLANVLNTPEFG